MADQYVPVPGGPNNNNYANVELIVDIAKRIPVQVSWPGAPVRPGVTAELWSLVVPHFGRGGGAGSCANLKARAAATQPRALGGRWEAVCQGRSSFMPLCLQAVWAGWGHASENPKLPELLCKHEIAFLGTVCLHQIRGHWGMMADSSGLHSPPRAALESGGPTSHVHCQRQASPGVGGHLGQWSARGKKMELLPWIP